jgi:UDP-N-acetyl-D-mannosaminuronic acid transferase (WecB/TagA/CpsF family)
MNYRTAQTAIAVARLEFVGLPFADFGMAQAVAALRLASQGAEWRYVVTPNAANLARWSSADPVLLDCYRNADFCFLDSRVISLASRLVGLRPPQVIPGSDLVEQLFQHAITPETTICIVGGGHDVMRTLRKRFGVGVISHVNPSFGFCGARSNALLNRASLTRSSASIRWHSDMSWK